MLFVWVACRANGYVYKKRFVIMAESSKQQKCFIYGRSDITFNMNFKPVHTKRRLRSKWQTTRVPGDKLNLNRAVKHIKRHLEEIQNQAMKQYLEKLYNI